MIKAGLIDYEMGNLHSVAKALSLHDCAVTVSNDARKLAGSDVLVLPGVGAFGAAMVQLAKTKMDDFVRRWILEEKRPFFGFCLGLQVLFDSSEESKEPGLGILGGRVVRFQPSEFEEGEYRVPHMGWNTLNVKPTGEPFYRGFAPGDRVYFVHTYFAEPKDNGIIATTTDYGRAFCSSIATGRVFATQFHPEKSGDVGRHLLANAMRLAAKESAEC